MQKDFATVSSINCSPNVGAWGLSQNALNNSLLSDKYAMKK